MSSLVECKYRQPGTSWVFTPYPSNIVPTGIINSTEDLVPFRIGSKAVSNFEESIGYCINGVELTNDGNGNTNGGKHGAFQLKFAMPEFLKNDYENLISNNIQQRFSKEFIEDNFNIPQEKAVDFLFYAQENGLDKDLLKPENEMQLMDFLLDKSKEYKKRGE